MKVAIFLLFVASASALPFLERFSLPFSKDDILNVGFAIIGELKNIESQTEEIVPATEEFIPYVESATDDITPYIYENPYAPEHMQAEVEEIVPATEEIVPATEEIVPATEEFIPYEESPRHQFRAAVRNFLNERIESATEEFIPYVESATDDITPYIYENPYAPEHMQAEVEEIVPATEEIVPATEEIVPATEEFIPYEESPRQQFRAAVRNFLNERIESATEEFIPYVESATDDITPYIYENPYAPEHMEAEVEEIVPATEEIVPATEEFIPYEESPRYLFRAAVRNFLNERIESATDDITPYIYENPYAPEHMQAEVEEIVPATEEIVPATEEFIPYVESATDDITPYVNEPENTRQLLQQRLERLLQHRA